MSDTLTSDRPKAKKRPLRTIDAKLRVRIEKAIEKLIETLDASVDTDEDSEVEDGPIDDDEREPSLGSPESYPRAADVGELIAARLEGLTGEPRRVAGGDQTSWCRGNNEDLEDEHDGSEPDDEGDDSDNEYSLVAAEGAGPNGLCQHGLADAELIPGFDRLRARNRAKRSGA